MKETQFIDDRTLRDKNVDRFEILEKVKKVLLIPNTDFMTVKQLAEYYSTYYKDKNKKDNIVTPDGIRKLYSLHSDELDSDGVCIKSYKDFLIGNEFTLENLKIKKPDKNQRKGLKLIPLELSLILVYLLTQNIFQKNRRRKYCHLLVNMMVFPNLVLIGVMENIA